MTLTLRSDAAALSAVLAEARASFAEADALHPAEGFLEAADRLLGAIEAGEELVALKVDDPPACASEIVVRLEPTDRLRGLVAALGARDGD